MILQNLETISLAVYICRLVECASFQKGTGVRWSRLSNSLQYNNVTLDISNSLPSDFS